MHLEKSRTTTLSCCECQTVKKEALSLTNHLNLLRVECRILSSDIGGGGGGGGGESQGTPPPLYETRNTAVIYSCTNTDYSHCMYALTFTMSYNVLISHNIFSGCREENFQ